MLNINELGQRPVLPGISDKDEKYDILSPTLYQKLDSIEHNKIVYHPVVALLTERKVFVYSKFNFCSFLLFLCYLTVIYLLQFTLSYSRVQSLSNHHGINFLNFLLVVGLINDMVIVIARLLTVLYRKVKHSPIYFSNWKVDHTKQKAKKQVTWFTTIQYNRKYSRLLNLKNKLKLPLKTQYALWFATEVVSYLLQPLVLLDWLGIMSLTVYLLSQWIGGTAQWIFASISFIANTLRLFKYITYSVYLGPYASSLYSALTRDIPRFLIIFSVILITFTGGFSLAIVQVNNASCNNFEEMAFCNASQTFLSGIRVLLDGHVFQDPNFMQNLGFYPSLIYIIFIILVVVFLLNFLVAQFCATYANLLPSHQRYKLKIAADFENTSLIYLVLGKLISLLTAVLKAKVTQEYWENILPNRSK